MIGKKILFTTDSLSVGGAERQLTLLVKHLPSECQCQVWSLGDGPFAVELRRAGVPVHLSPRRWRWDVLSALSLWRVVWEWRPDIVHSYGYMGTLAARLPCRCLHIPLVDGAIRTTTELKHLGRLRRRTLEYGDRVIANSEAGLRAFQIDTARGRVVYNGFDPERLRCCTPKLGRDLSKPFTVVMAARMHPMKDFDSFIRAARLLAKDDTCAWQFWAIGDGPRRMELMEAAHDLIRKNVLRFLGEEMEVLPRVREADVGLLLTAPGSNQEGCSNSIMEYMACGLPVVCSDSGGNRELIVDGVTGFTVPPRDVNALLEKLLWLRANPEEAQAMGVAARRRLLKEFTVDKLVDKTLSVYAELLPSAQS